MGIKGWLTRRKRRRNFQCETCGTTLEVIDATWDEYIWDGVVTWEVCTACKKRRVNTFSVPQGREAGRDVL